MQKKHAAELLEEQRQQIAAATKGARDYPLTDEEMGDIVDFLEGTSALLYSTHSHRSEKKNGLNCFRLVIELD
jgi:predicted site-specific integrase-resolvase